jgi:hypothetical protein
MKKHSIKIQIGARLLLAGFAIATGNIIALALALFMPVFTQVNPLLGISAEEQKELEKLMKKQGEEAKEFIQTEIKELAKGLTSTTEFEKKMTALGLTDGVIKELTEAVKKQGEKLREIEDAKGKDTPQKSMEDIVKEKATEIKALVSASQNTEVKIIVPAVNKTVVTRAGLSNSTLGMFLPDVGQSPTISTVIRPLFRQGRISANSNGVIRYIDQNVITRNAAFVAEGALKPESAITWIQRSLELQKIADSIPVTKEAWADIDFIQSEIRQLLEVNIKLKEDDALYDGTGVAPQITGIYTYAPTFDAAAYAADANMPKFQDANLYDLVAVLRAVIMLNQGNKFDPKIVLMNPMDTLRYKLMKATDGHYLIPPFVSSDGMVIDGMRVVESSQVTANTLVIGDFQYGTVYDDGQGIEITMGWINDDFLKNQWRILAEERLALLVRTIYLPAFRKVTSISAALTAITEA